MKKLKKIKIAITGNIGCGKSTFAKFLSEAGFPVIYADEISKEILANDQSVREEIVKELGTQAFDGDKIDKKFIASVIFSDSKKLKKINSTLHPKVRKKIEELTKNYFTTSDVVFVEAALIYESKIEKMYDYIILITSDVKLRLQRAVKAKNLSEDEFLKREANQIDAEIKKKKADFIFANNGTKEELKQKAMLLIHLLKASFQ